MIQALRKTMWSLERIAASNLRQCYQYSILSCEQVLITLTTTEGSFLPSISWWYKRTEANMNNGRERSLSSV